MNPAVFNLIWQQIVVPIDGATGAVTNALMAWTGPRFKLAVLAYLVCIMLIAAWSSDNAAFTRFFKQLFLAGIVYTIAATLPAFQYYVVGLVQGFVDGISGSISTLFGGTGTITADMFDVIMVKVFAFGGNVFTHLSWTSPKSYFLALCVVVYWLISAAAIFVIFTIFLMSTVLSRFLLSFGPIFVALYYFPFTRAFFDGWLRAIVAGILTQVFTIGWLAMFTTVFTGILATLAAGVGVNDLATQIFAIVLAVALVGIFSTMTAFSALAAVRIANGVHAQVVVFRAPPPPSNPPPSGATGGNGGGGSSGGGGGRAGNGSTAGGGGAPSSGSGGGSVRGPVPVYAFNRNVGAAS